jgi:hypothetical protein
MEKTKVAEYLLVDRTFTTNNLSGLLNDVVAMMIRIRENKHVVVDTPAEVTMELWNLKADADRIQEWFKSCYDNDPTGEMDKDEVTTNQNRWAVEHSVKPLDKTTLARKLRLCGVFSEEINHVGEKRRYVFVGLKPKGDTKPSMHQLLQEVGSDRALNVHQHHKVEKYDGRCMHAGCEKPVEWVCDNLILPTPLCNFHYHCWT